MKAWQLIVGLAAMAGAVGLIGYLAAPSKLPRSVVGQAAPQFAAPEIRDGEVHALHQYRGKVLLVNFWASWCEPCRHEHANLQRLMEMFGDRQDFAMLGIVHRDQPADARQFLRQWGGGYPNLADPDGAIGASFGLSGLPQTFLVDPAGVVRCKHFGPIGSADLEKIAGRWIGASLEGRFMSCN